MVDFELLSETLSIFYSNPYFVPFIISMLPIAELRLAIPYGLLIQNLHLDKIILVSIAGNFIVTIPIFLLLKYVSKNLMKYRYFNLFMTWIFNRTRRKSKYIEKYKFFGLILFVGIPLPVTGAWTGCVASYLFNIDNKKTFLGLFIGICMSACIVSLLTIFGYYVIN